MRLRYSLRTFLVLVVIFAVILSFWIKRAAKQKDVVDKILALGGSIYYSKDTSITSDNSDMLLHLFSSVNTVILRPNTDCPSDVQLELLAELPSHHKLRLSIWPEQIGNTINPRASGGMTDRGARTIVERLGQLEYLNAFAANCNDKALMELKDHLLNTKFIHVLMQDSKQDQLVVERDVGNRTMRWTRSGGKGGFQWRSD